MRHPKPPSTVSGIGPPPAEARPEVAPPDLGCPSYAAVLESTRICVMPLANLLGLGLFVAPRIRICLPIELYPVHMQPALHSATSPAH